MRKRGLLKLLTFLLAGLLSISLLAGCGSSKEKDAGTKVDGGESSQKKEQNDTEERGKTVTIKFWHHYNEQSNENRVLNEIIIPEFEKKYKNIKVQAAPHEWADLHKKVLVSASTNELPDIIRADSAWIPEFESLDILVALDKEMEDFSEVAGKILEGPMNTAKVKGNYYGLGLNTNSKVLFYNTRLFKEAGIEVPKTLDDFFEAARALTKEVNGQKIWGYAEPALSGWNMCPFIWSNGGAVTDPNQKVASNYMNSKDNVEIIQKFVKLYKDGAMAGFMSGDIPMTDGFAQGRYAMIIDGPWKFAELSGGHPDFKDFAVAPMPAGKGGSVQVLGGEDIAMFNTANKEAAWEFMKFMTGELSQIEMAKVGQIPVNINAAESQDVKSIENFGAFLEAIKTAKARPTVSVWPQMDSVLSDAITVAILGEKTTIDALNEAAVKMDKLLNEQ